MSESDSQLTSVEAAELAMLRALAGRGKLVADSPGATRYLGLLKIEGGAARIESPPLPRWERAEVMSFYGIGMSFFYAMAGIGEQMNRPVPWENPVSLGEWFALAKAQGHRKHAPPAGVLKKIQEARIAGGRVDSMPDPAAHPPKSPGKSEASPSFTLEMDGSAATTADIILDMGQEIRALQARKNEFLAAGKTFDAAGVSARLDIILNNYRQWNLSAERIRAGDEEQKAEMMRQMAAWARDAWAVIRRAVFAHIPADDRDQWQDRLNLAAAELPGLLREHFGVKEEEAA